MIAHKDEDGNVTLEWDAEEHSAKIDRQVLELMIAEINDAQRLRRALRSFLSNVEEPT